MGLRTAPARRHLDARFERLRPLAGEGRPPAGWIRAIREALGMSTAELGTRMGISQSRVSRVERSEADGTINIDTLRRAAEALDCDVFYVLLPRTPLRAAVEAQARHKASVLIDRVTHNMRLEDQAVGVDDEQIDELVASLIDRRGLWSDTGRPA